MRFDSQRPGGIIFVNITFVPSFTDTSRDFRTKLRHKRTQIDVNGCSSILIRVDDKRQVALTSMCRLNYENHCEHIYVKLVFKLVLNSQPHRSYLYKKPRTHAH